jgi:hypothetical protein
MNDASDNTARASKERAVRIMKRAVSFLQIKEAAFPSHKGAAIIEEMQGFIVGNEAPQVETGDVRSVLEEIVATVNERPRGVTKNHPLIARAREVLGPPPAKATVVHQPGCWKLQSPSGQGVCNCGAE